MAERELDTRSLLCPLPVLKARKQLRGMAPGDRLRVLATDPKAPGDLRELCAATGDRLVEQSEAQGVFQSLIEKS
jgi:tRNA 2-thiouridine synthesizing protein A